MNENFFKIGTKVCLFPGDTYTKIAIIEDINELGFVFRLVEGTNSKSDYSIGDIIFRSMGVAMKIVK